MSTIIGVGSRLFGTAFALSALPGKVTAILAETSYGGAARQPDPWTVDSRGSSISNKLLPLFDRLHDVGCQRDKAGNRKLHFDHYCALILLFLLNPVLRSFRALQAASLLEQVRRKVGCPRTSLGSLSEAVEILEPERLEGIIAELWAEVPPSRGVGKESVRRVLTAVDASVVKTLASLAEAAYLRDRNGQAHCGWRFHTHFEIDRQLPVRIEVTSASTAARPTRSRS